MFPCIPSSIFILELLYCFRYVGATTSGSVPTAPTPLSIPPSEFWDGNDGPWSSFELRVGSPPQTVRVLISTSSNQPWVVIPEGCSLCIPSDCPEKRGGIFYSNRSSTWSQNTMSIEGLFSLPVDANLGSRSTGTYGYDTVALSNQDSGIPTLGDQVVSGIATRVIHTGFFGLNPAATNFSANVTPTPSYMSNLKNHGMIPSLSYGYTAGNHYRSGKPLGSLTLGGYDASLFEPNELKIPFSIDPDFELSINIKSIVMTTEANSLDLSPGYFTAVIDSTIAYLYLPVKICQKFEEAFGLVYDEATSLYLVDGSLHERLLEQSANVTFTLTNSTEEVLVNVTLPYRAFDLIAEYPLVPDRARYFPLKRAANSSQITLGRTFLQEAYIIADYERRQFSIHQRTWNTNTPTQQIQTILPLQSTNPPTIQSSTPQHRKAIIAISATIGSVILIALLIIATLLFRRRRAKISVFLATQSLRYRSHTPSMSDRPRISRPILIPSSPEIEHPSTPNRNTHLELDSSPVSPVSPEMECGPPLSLASRMHHHSRQENSQARYLQLYEEIIQEGQEQRFASEVLEDPFYQPPVEGGVYELPATPGFRKEGGATMEEEMEGIYRRVAEVERAMIREGQESRRRELRGGWI